MGQAPSKGDTGPSGPQGIQGFQGEQGVGIKSIGYDSNTGHLILKMSDDSSEGPFTISGKPGVGISKATMGDKGLSLTMTDNSVLGPYDIRGPPGVSDPTVVSNYLANNNTFVSSLGTEIAANSTTLSSNVATSIIASDATKNQIITSLIAQAPLITALADKLSVAPYKDALKGNTGTLASAESVKSTLSPVTMWCADGSCITANKENIIKSRSFHAPDNGWMFLQGGSETGTAVVNGMSIKDNGGLSVGQWKHVPQGTVEITGDTFIGGNLKIGNNNWQNLQIGDWQMYQDQGNGRLVFKNTKTNTASVYITPVDGNIWSGKSQTDGNWTRN